MAKTPTNRPDVQGRPDRPEYKGDQKDAKAPDLSGPLHRHLGHFAGSAVIKAGHNTLGKETIPAKGGHPAITFQKGGEHQSLGVPQGQKIPASKERAAARGDYGPKAQKQEQFRENVLTGGRKKK